jgi:hypothetical protein
MKTILAIGVLALALQAKPAAGLDQIKKLEGSWESTDKDHPCSVSYKASAGGSIVVESMSMGDHGEMLTVYHPDGDALVLTHYCMLGNQPRMKAAKESKPGTLRFACEGGSNLKCATDKHMHALTLTFVDADHLKQEWTLVDGGKELTVVTINLSRKRA